MERVDALIERVMQEYPGVSKLAHAKYFEEVHQELAPLARNIEQQHDNLKTILSTLLVEVDSEIEQRKFSGNDEDWKYLESLSTAAHAAIVKPTYPDLIAAAHRMEELQAQYLADYEEGESGYVPNEQEQLLIQDAVAGLLSDEMFIDAFVGWRLLARRTS